MIVIRILHVIDYFQPLLGYQETYLARIQREHGHVVRVVTSDRRSPVIYSGGASNEVLGPRIVGTSLKIEDGIEVHRLPVIAELHNMVWMRGLEDAVKSFSPDVIHVHEYLSMTTVRIAKLKRRMSNTRLIIDEHKTFSPLNTSVVAKPVYLLFNTLFKTTILKNADAIVAVRSGTKLLMEELYRVPSDRITIIPLGCDSRRFKRSEVAGLTLLESLNLDPDVPLYCYVGRVRPEKGVHLLVDATISILQQHIRVHCMMVGGTDKEYQNMIARRIRYSGHSKDFTFLPAVPNKDLWRYYSMADVGVWPKQCSISMLEAMSCSVPIIISDKSGATEYVTERGSGLTYEEESVVDLASKMMTMLNDAYRKVKSDSARAYAESNDWNQISIMFEKLYARE